MTDTLPQWLSVPETMSTSPEMLDSVYSFQKGAVCAAEAETKARVFLVRLVHMMWAGEHQVCHRNPREAQDSKSPAKSFSEPARYGGLRTTETVFSIHSKRKALALCLGQLGPAYTHKSCG